MSNPFWSTPFTRTLLLLLAGLALPLLWPGLFLNLFSTAGFEVEHHHDWPGSLVALHVGSDLLIGVAYAVIASILAFIVFQNRKHLPFDWVVLSFGLFIIACGITHIMHVVTRFTPVYYLDAYLRALTAIVSVATAIALPPLIPRVRALLLADQNLKVSRDELQEANTMLHHQQHELENARNWAEFHASLSDLLQMVHDPATLADRALRKIGPALSAEQVTLIRISKDWATLWHFWGDLKPEARSFLEGDGTPLSELKLLHQVVESRERYYTNLYPQEGDTRVIADHPIAAAFEPIMDAQGEVVAVLAFSRPNHQPWTEQERQLASRAAFTLSLALERTELHRQLLLSQQALLEAEQHSPIAELTVSLTGKPLKANPAALRMLGYTEEELLQLEMTDINHPDHLPELYFQLDRMLRGEVDTLMGEPRHIRKDGSVFWVHLHVSLVRDSDGKPHHLIVQFTDITDRKVAEAERDRAERYSQAQARISKLLEDNLTPEEMAQQVSAILHKTTFLDFTGLMTVDGEVGNVKAVHWSEKTPIHLLSHIQNQIPRGLGMVWKSLEEDHAVFVEHYQQQAGVHPTMKKAGVSALASVPLIPLSSKNPKPKAFMAAWVQGQQTWKVEDRNLLQSAVRTLRVAFERQEHLLQLEQAALYDALTGLGNRRAFEQDLKGEHARAKRHGECMGLMVLDLDGLKTINDHMGHEAGDRLLQKFGQALKSTMRLEDRCYRLGGDEFAVILTHCPLESSMKIHQRVQTMMDGVKSQGFQHTGVSVGIGYFPEERSTPEDLFRLADERMYLMKAQHHLERE